MVNLRGEETSVVYRWDILLEWTFLSTVNVKSSGSTMCESTENDPISAHLVDQIQLYWPRHCGGAGQPKCLKGHKSTSMSSESVTEGNQVYREESSVWVSGAEIIHSGCEANQLI